MKDSWVWWLRASTHAAVMIMALLSYKTHQLSLSSPPPALYCSLVHVKNKQSKYNHFWIKPSLRQLAGGVHASFSKMLEKILGTSLEMQSEK